MSLSKTTLGNFELYTIEAGDIKLDGGAMFGVVPKTLWSRGIEPDDKNRIPMTMRCLLIKSKETGRVYLIDNGVGDKFNDKMSDIYQIDFSRRELHRSLEAQGFTADDITDIIFTHLHFDHCGGTSTFNESGELVHVFKNATYHVNKRHWKNAIDPNARETASFLPDNINPLKETDRLNLVDDDHVYENGLYCIIVNGHTLGQQLPVIKGDTKTLVYTADLLPTHVHLPLPWVMGYDMQPLETLQEKETFLRDAVEKNWYLYLEHDLFEEVITIQHDGRKYSVEQKLTLNDL